MATTTLRGDPSRLAVGDIRSALEAGASASAAFLGRLEADPRAGARALAARFRRRAEKGRHDEALLLLERRHWAAGLQRVAGVDEAGMGPLAGPIVAAAVILRPDGPIPDARDSKVLAAADRERLLGEICAHAVAVAVGIAEVAEIAELDVYRAGLLAMQRAVLALDPPPEALLVDARTVPGVAWPQEAHVKGDARSRSIAAASIVAKVRRDAIMARLAEEHPGYGFERHAGYGVPEHLQALRRLGPCAAHRMSWDALKEHAGEMTAAFYELRDELKALDGPRALAAWRRAVTQRAGTLTPGEVRRLDALAKKRERALGAPPRKPSPSLPLA